MSWFIDYSDWRIYKRFEDLNSAYLIGLREAPAAIYAETSYHVEEFLKGILPALLQMCIVQAASTVIGAGIGAGLGAFVFGAGAIPGAAIGAELGFDLGLAILTWLGLAFLVVAIGHSLGDIVSLIKTAIVQAWGAADKGDARGQNVRQAGQTLARAIAILVRLILTGIVAWLTKKGIDKAPELIAELKASKLGAGFAAWVEKNLGKLMNDPKLRGHAQGEGATTKAGADTQAQSPSQLAKRPVEEAPPPPPPPRPRPRPVTRAEAHEFYKELGWPDSRINSHLDGIDFSKPVTIETLPKGTVVDQWVDPVRGVGNYFAPPGTPASELGIYQGNRVPTSFVLAEDTPVLRSTAAPILDTWSAPPATFQTTGGGTQFFTQAPQNFIKGP